jgi:hypothetical protein
VLRLANGGPSMRFDVDDALVGPDVRIRVADSGDVQMRGGGAAGATPWRIQGDVQSARRTAAFLVLATMAAAAWTSR